jgi:hypothetical protein
MEVQVTTPDALTAPSNAPSHHPSIAETVLAEATAAHAPEEAASPEPATSDVEPSMVEAMAEGDVEVEDVGDDGKPRTRNLSWDDAIRQVPPDIASLMKNMRADYTRKTQELAEQRRDFVREREALMKGADTLKEVEVPDYDPFNEQSINARIEAEVTRRLREVLEPMQAEYETMAAEDSYKSFLSAHPDFKEDKALRSEVQHMLEANESLDLETAYWAAKGKQAKAEREKERTRKAADRRARKEAAMKGTAPPRRASVGGKPSRANMRKMTNADLLALAKSMHRNG